MGPRCASELPRRAAALARAIALTVLLLGAPVCLGSGPLGHDHRPLMRAGARTTATPVESDRPLNGPATAAPAGLLRTGLSLALVVGLVLAGAALVRRLAGRRAGLSLSAAVGPGGPSPAGLLEVLGRYPLARGQTLILLRLERRVLLLSHTTGGRLGRSAGLHTLAELADPDEVASIIVKTRDADGESISARFNELLGAFAGAPAAEADSAGIAGRLALAGPDLAPPDREPESSIGSVRARLAQLRGGAA
ncbi:MAG TPA: hypothetical protein VD963_05090 [Phycisphaerales bacterium]|nr:hypothetical protein [Phycisphaerales bacterium]